MQQLHPKAVWLFFLTPSMGNILIYVTLEFLVIIFVFVKYSLLPQQYLGFLWYISLFGIGLTIYFIVLYIWARLTYRYYKYELSEDGFRKELGVIWKKYTTIPYDRIQNVDIYRGVIDRILGLSELHIQTAGIGGFSQWGALSEGRLPGLLPETAEKLRDELIKRTRNSKGLDI